MDLLLVTFCIIMSFAGSIIFVTEFGKGIAVDDSRMSSVLWIDDVELVAFPLTMLPFWQSTLAVSFMCILWSSWCGFVGCPFVGYWCWWYAIWFRLFIACKSVGLYGGSLPESGGLSGKFCKVPGKLAPKNHIQLENITNRKQFAHGE